MTHGQRNAAKRPGVTGIPGRINTMQVQSFDAPAYNVIHATEDDCIIAKALEILDRRVFKGPAMSSPTMVRDYLTLQAAKHDGIEVFSILLLDAQHQVIEYREMFRGTLTQTSVYPREVVRAALAVNASAVILTHNHPSGALEPSRADELLTQTLKSSLNLVDVRVLDHIITAGGKSLSFAERGLL